MVSLYLCEKMAETAPSREGYAGMGKKRPATGGAHIIQISPIFPGIQKQYWLHKKMQNLLCSEAIIVNHMESLLFLTNSRLASPC